MTCLSAPPAAAATPNIGASGGELLLLDNGTAKIDIDHAKGTAITHLSRTAYPQNMVNSADPGRLIQPSYYAGLLLDRRADRRPPPSRAGRPKGSAAPSAPLRTSVYFPLCPRPRLQQSRVNSRGS